MSGEHEFVLLKASIDGVTLSRWASNGRRIHGVDRFC